MVTQYCTAVKMTIEEKHPNFTIVFALHLTDSKKVWVMEFHEKITDSPTQKSEIKQLECISIII